MYQLLHSLLFQCTGKYLLCWTYSFLLRTQVKRIDCIKLLKYDHVQNGLFITITFTYLLVRLVGFRIIIFIPINFQIIPQVKCSIQRNSNLFHLGIYSQRVVHISRGIFIWFLKYEPQVLRLSFQDTQIPSVGSLYSF